MAKLTLEGGFEAELCEGIERNRKLQGGKGAAHRSPPIISLEASDPNRLLRVRCLLEEWPAVKAAMDEAIKRLVVNK